jgi:thioredoxin-dependent peroxiredoxin
LKDYVGKRVVLYFYPKDDSPGCTREAVEFRDLAEEFEKQGAVIVGVSKDSIESHQRFKQKHDLPFTLLSDPEAKVLDRMGCGRRKASMGERTWALSELLF